MIKSQKNSFFKVVPINGSFNAYDYFFSIDKINGNNKNFVILQVEPIGEDALLCEIIDKTNYKE